MIRTLRLLLAGVVFLSVVSCGYKMAGSDSVAIPREYRKICIAKVENPSLDTWLEPVTRASLRDELSRRGYIQVVDRDEANALFFLKIKRYGVASRLLGEKDETLKYDANITLEARIVAKESNKLLWSSGEVSTSESYISGGQDAARSEAVNQAIRRLADRMEQDF